MLDFVFESFEYANKKCGCYAVNADLLSEHSYKPILVPLRSCDYNLQIVNAMVNVTLTQVYQNPTEKFLQVQYSFPINPNACVYRFVAIFGKTRIEGVVKEKEQAKKEYEEAIKQGKKAAYGQQNAQSKDILNLKIGNIGPKQEVKIEIVYLQELTLSYNTFYQLHLSSTITPRYFKNIPEQQILAGFRKDPSLPTHGTFNWSFQISLRTTRKVTFFNSNTHDIQVISQNASKTQSLITLKKACLPNKDFVFSFTTEDFELPSYVFGRNDKSSSVMLSFIPKFCTLNINDAYKASIEGKTLQGNIDTAKAEYIFLLDRSGSMSGPRMQKAKQALILFIKSLPEDSYFNVVSFGSGSSKLFTNGSMIYDNKNIDYAVEQVKTMSADMGGTEVYAPLYDLLQQKPKQGYPKQIFLLTDGGVSNTEGVLKMVSSNNKFARVHTIGIGNGASEALIKGCAKNGKGYHVFINDEENPSEKIIQLLSDSLSAVISKINLDYDSNVVESIIPNPKSLPYFLKGEIVNFYITFKGQLASKTNFVFSYEDSQNKLPYSSKIEIDPQSTNESFIDRMAHFKRIRVLQESHNNKSELQENIYFVKTIDKKAEIIKQSVDHQILSEFTAFICVQKQLVDGKYQEIVQTGKEKVYINSPLPAELQKQQQPFQYYRLMQMQSSAPEMLMKRSAPMREEIYDSSARMKQLKCCAMKSVRPKSPGVIDKISNFFKGIFSKEQSSQEVPMSRKAPQRKQKKKVQKKSEQIKEEKEQKKEEQQKKELKKEEKSTKLIERLVAEQDSSGCWKDISLVQLIFDASVEKVVRSQKYMYAAAAYLIAKWISKNHPQKQYSLIVKKGLNYAQKQAANFSEFPSLLDQYIK